MLNHWALSVIPLLALLELDAKRIENSVFLVTNLINIVFNRLILIRGNEVIITVNN